jgi:hypothetical protein
VADSGFFTVHDLSVLFLSALITIRSIKEKAFFNQTAGIFFDNNFSSDSDGHQY